MKRTIAILLAIMLVFTFTACNTTSEEEPKETASEETEEKEDTKEAEEPAEEEEVELAQGIYDDKIVVGNSAATSGNYAPVGVPFNEGIKAYFDYINSQGGVNGRMIEFIHKDDEFDPVKGKAMLTELVEDEEIFALVGHFGTPVVGATIEDVKSIGIPAVYFATGIGQLYADKATEENNNIFPVQPIYKTEGQIMVSRAVSDFGAKKIGVIYTSDDAGKDLYEGAKKKAEELGVELVVEQVAAGATDVSSAVTSIKNAEVDFILSAAIQATFPTIVKELAAQDVNKGVITTYVNVSPILAQAVANEIKGKFDVYGLGWVSFEGDRADALALYAETIDDEYDANVFGMTGWIAGHFFVEGLKRVEGPLTWDNFIAAMESEPIQNPFGGSIDYSDGKRLGTQEMNLSKINPDNDDGEWVAVDGLKSMEELLK